MAAEPIVDVATVKGWSSAQDNVEDDELMRLIAASSAWLEGHTGRVLRPPAGNITTYLDGSGERVNGRWNEILHLPSAPAVSVTSITENGIARTFASGYTTTADVVVVLEDAKLVRRAGVQAVADSGLPGIGWAEGIQNIAVVWQPGYASVPQDIAQACVELTWLIYRESTRQGRESMSRGGMSISFVRELSPFVADVVERYRDWRRAL